MASTRNPVRAARELERVRLDRSPPTGISTVFDRSFLLASDNANETVDTAGILLVRFERGIALVAAFPALRRAALVAALRRADDSRLMSSGFGTIVRRGAGRALALASVVIAPAAAQENACRADYKIAVRVSPEERALSGDETIHWKNGSRDDVFDLQFHLYWNAFANNRSTHMRESGGTARGSTVELDEWGWQRVTSIRVGGVELVDKLRFIQPDDAQADDRTVFSVPLGKLASPGETLTIEVRWEARIPRVRERTGCKDDFLFIAQWFPKLGVYDSGNGWNCHQFHASTEFFADYGAYDVTLDLPARYENEIGASGVLAEPEKRAGDRVLAHFIAPSEADQKRADQLGKLPLVHDFAWTADPRYVVLDDFKFRYDEWAARFKSEVDDTALALGRGVDELRERDVDVTLLLHPEHASQAERHFEATCASLFFYGLWFGGYPYEHITVVDPAWGAGGAGGMEYPTLFTCGSRMFTFPSMHTPESVTVHECGHQFWYGLVGNNEFEAAWLDEGFNTFSQNETMPRVFGPSHRVSEFSGLYFDGVAVAKDPGGGALADALALRTWTLPKGIAWHPVHASAFVEWWRSEPLLSFARMREDPRIGARNGYLADPDSDPIDTPGWRYVDRQSYAQNSYRRPSVMLATLQGLVGREKFERGMRLYSEHWRYGHPYPQDFFTAFKTGANVDVDWFFDEAFRSTATVDWSVEVDQKRTDAASGWFPTSTGAYEHRESPADRVADANGTDGPSSSSAQDDPSHPWKIAVVVRRKGTFLLPLDLQLTYEGGVRETLTWSREDQTRSTWWKPLEGREPSTRKLVSAVLDPERAYLVDTDMSNNQWFDEVDPAPAWRWGERVLTQCSHILHWYGGLGG
jgi:hypothetical protein